MHELRQVHAAIQASVHLEAGTTLVGVANTVSLTAPTLYTSKPISSLPRSIVAGQNPSRVRRSSVTHSRIRISVDVFIFRRLSHSQGSTSLGRNTDRSRYRRHDEAMNDRSVPGNGEETVLILFAPQFLCVMFHRLDVLLSTTLSFPTGLGSYTSCSPPTAMRCSSVRPASPLSFLGLMLLFRQLR